MVMGKTHIGAGACSVTVAGAGVVALGWGGGLVAHPETTVLVVLVCLAHFLRPDIDHHRATATRCFGWLSKREHQLWVLVCAWYYEATRAAGDPVEPRTHRGLTHTPVGAVLFALQSAFLVGFSQPASRWAAGLWSPGLLVTPFVPLWGTPGGSGWAAVAYGTGTLAGYLSAMLARALGGALVVAGAWPVIGVLFCAGCAALIAAPYAWAHRWWYALLGLVFGLLVHRGLADDWAWVACAAALGAYGHDLGDGCTNSGAPLKHPMTEIVDTERGRLPCRWVDHGTPTLLRYPAGSRRETFWFFVTVTATVVIVLVAGWFRLSGGVPLFA